MRTTVTLDSDVEKLLKQAMRKEGLTFKETVNRAVRAGLAAPQSVKRRGKYELKPRALGFRSNCSPGQMLALLDIEADLDKMSRAK